PSAVPGTALAAKTCSVPRRPMPDAFCSYQTTHGTVSLLPVKAKSGSMPSRVGSMLRVGSPVADEAGVAGFRRLMPVCCQQNVLTLVPPPGALAEQSVCLIPREAKIWFSAASSVAAPSFSCQATHGTGSLPATAAPPTSAGFSAVRSVWMFSDVTTWPGARSWPSGTHTFAVALNRLAKMFVFPPGRFEFGSYHAVHGTLRPVPAKSIEGASASWFAWMLSDWPWVTQRPFLKARTKICCEGPVFCSNAAHGTFGAPGTREPPTTSDTPASWLGSMPTAGSSLTWVPSAGRPTTAADAVPANASTTTRTAGARRRRWNSRDMKPPARSSTGWGLQRPRTQPPGVPPPPCSPSHSAGRRGRRAGPAARRRPARLGAPGEPPLRQRPAARRAEAREVPALAHDRPEAGGVVGPDRGA